MPQAFKPACLYIRCKRMVQLAYLYNIESIISLTTATITLSIPQIFQRTVRSKYGQS
jgi:hypothetical protein